MTHSNDRVPKLDIMDRAIRTAERKLSDTAH